MKKSLLALAVMGAFAGAAYAQSSVTVYGIVDLGFESASNGADTNSRKNGIESGGQSASRIGFKGTEDLGNGLKALFQLESTIRADDGTGFGAGSGFNRFATVGLQSATFGTVLLGRQTSVIKDAYDQIDPFGDGGRVANISKIFFNGELDGDAGRISNSIKYQSNSFSGFKASVAYGFGEVRGKTSANSNFGVGLGYANGPLNVQYGYHNQDDTDAATLVKQGKNKLHFLGATYDFGVAKLHGAFADTKFDTVGGVNEKYRNYMIGVSAPVGPGTIFASYAVNDNKTNGVNDADTKKIAISYSYDLSKRTNLYTGYSKTSNDAGAQLGAAAAGGKDPSTFNVGIRHKF